MSAFITNPITSALKHVNTTQIRCRKHINKLPKFAPVIYSLSKYSSSVNEYSIVSITGDNFLPNRATYVNFGPYKNIKIIYYSSNNISFVVPSLPVGSYNIIVVNIYNDSFKTPLQTSYQGKLNYSNSIFYTLY